jgi:iron complex transport system ATP-binding protein
MSNLRKELWTKSGSAWKTFPFLETLEHLGRAPGGPTMIFVTHHLQEIMPTSAHAILLKEGRCVGQGQKAEILRSELLTEAFGVPVTVNEEGNRYRTRVPFGATLTQAGRGDRPVAPTQSG